MTRLVNKTGERISFDVDYGSFPVRVLPAGQSRSVSTELVMELCIDRGSTDWPIRVLINGRFHGMCLHPNLHIFSMPRIVFKYKPGGFLIAEGTKASCFDYVCCWCICYEKRTYHQIAEADSTWNNPHLSKVGNSTKPPEKSLRKAQQPEQQQVGRPEQQQIGHADLQADLVIRICFFLLFLILVS